MTTTRDLDIRDVGIVRVELIDGSSTNLGQRYRILGLVERGRVRPFRGLGKMTGDVAVPASDIERMGEEPALAIAVGAKTRLAVVLAS